MPLVKGFFTIFLVHTVTGRMAFLKSSLGFRPYILFLKYQGWISFSVPGNFQAGDPGAVLKKYDPREQKAFVSITKDILRSYAPEYRGIVAKSSERILFTLKYICGYIYKLSMFYILKYFFLYVIGYSQIIFSI